MPPQINHRRKESLPKKAFVFPSSRHALLNNQSKSFLPEPPSGHFNPPAVSVGASKSPNPKVGPGGRGQ